MQLDGRVIQRSDLNGNQIHSMFSLMNEFYDNVSMDVFRKDLDDKDYCLLLHNEAGDIVGFTTQKIMSFELRGAPVHGVFSGDTIIHRDYWGSLEMYVVFARFFFALAKEYPCFYWFLISKGYKTYRMLPVFFKEFYPSYKQAVPPHLKAIMDAYASLLYPEEYNPKTGVIEYSTALPTSPERNFGTPTSGSLSKRIRTIERVTTSSVWRAWTRAVSSPGPARSFSGSRTCRLVAIW